MKKMILIVLIVVFVVISVINISLFSKVKKCTYEINTDYYDETIEVDIKYFSDIKITKEYKFNNKEILNKEKELLFEDNYDVKNNDLKLTATKKVKNKNYNNSIKEYEQLGFKCK